MPVDPNWKYVDTPHEKTVTNSSYRYGCNSLRNGDTRPRGLATSLVVQNGWTEDGRRITEQRVTQWQSKFCGHDLRASDPNCQGCVNLKPNETPTT